MHKTDVLQVIFDNFAAAASTSRMLKIFSAVYPIVIMCRLFKSFAAQPRLSLVTRTLAATATDVAHFGIVFFAIFLSYSIMGTVLFGREVPDFSTFDLSILACFR